MRRKRKLISALLFSAAPLITSAACIESTEDRAPSDENAPPELLSLRAELAAAEPATALARMPHFRPLCDAEGYPLVGNVANKAPGAAPSPGLQPSQFCAKVREQS
jgi:hypothetical protein